MFFMCVLVYVSCQRSYDTVLIAGDSSACRKETRLTLSLEASISVRPKDAPFCRSVASPRVFGEGLCASVGSPGTSEKRIALCFKK